MTNLKDKQKDKEKAIIAQFPVKAKLEVPIKEKELQVNKIVLPDNFKPFTEWSDQDRLLHKYGDSFFKGIDNPIELIKLINLVKQNPEILNKIKEILNE